MNNVFKEELFIGRGEREKLLNQRGKVLWFTGLSGSGKSTIGKNVEIELYKKGRLTYLLDGDNLRLGLNSNLGFSIEDRIENIRRTKELCKILLELGVVVIVTLVSPLREERNKIREELGEDFIEVYINTPLEVCEARDVKGLYKKVRSGEINNFTGITSPFEEPLNPEIKIDTSKVKLEEAVEIVLKKLE